jgi:ABC-2 type transport system permease protein
MAERKQTAKKAAAPAGGQGLARGAESIGFLAVVVAALVLLNIFVYFFPWRGDLTAARLYSLSQGSERLVGNLDETMEITAYFTADLPEPFNATEQYVRNLLQEYAAASNGKIQVRFVNPDDEDEREAAEADGVREVQHQVFENDGVSVRSGYRGLVIRYKGDREVLAVIQDTQGLEYAITQAIRKLVGEQIRIGVVKAHGTAEPTKGLAVLRQSLPSYEMEEIDLTESIDPDHTKALLIVSPTEAFTETELRRINQFVMRGGSLGIFGGSMNLELTGMAPTASPVDTRVNQLLNAWGLSIDDAMVADARCEHVPMRTQMGIPMPVPYPPMPLVIFDPAEIAEHMEEPGAPETVLFRLNQARMFFTSPIRVRDTFHRLHGRVLARSSEQSWLLTGDSIELQPRHPREWRETFGSQNPRRYVLMAGVSGRLPTAFPSNAPMSGAEDDGGPEIDAPARSARNVRLFVSGSGALVRDEFLPSPEQQAQRGMTGELALALNAIDWLAQDEDLIAIRAKNIEDPAIDVPKDLRDADAAAREVTARQEAGEGEEGENDAELQEALDEREEAAKSWETRKLLYRWGITAGVPTLIVLAGLLRWMLRRNKRANLAALGLRKPTTTKR